MSHQGHHSPHWTGHHHSVLSTLDDTIGGSILPNTSPPLRFYPIKGSSIEKRLTPLYKPGLIEGDKHNGFYISAKALDITWGNDERFWRWVGLDMNESSELKFQEGAELVQVNWFEVKGKLDAAKLSPSKTYEVHYIIKFTADAFGWHSSPITFEVKPPHGHKSGKTELLESYRKMCDVWHDIHGGEFTLTSDTRGNLEFGMFGDGSDWWKGGMILRGVVIKPKQSSELEFHLLDEGL